MRARRAGLGDDKLLAVRWGMEGMGGSLFFVGMDRCCFFFWDVCACACVRNSGSFACGFGRVSGDGGYEDGGVM